MEKNGVKQLTLITCYPFHAIMPGGPMRYVVRAVEAHQGLLPKPLM